MVVLDTEPEFSGTCSALGAEYLEPHEGIHVCRRDGNEVVLYEETGNAEIKQEGVTTWSGRASDLVSTGDAIVLEDAEGNPGPRHGPMHVEGAEVRFDKLGVTAEETRRY